MKITINTEASVKDTEIFITCNHLTPEIERIISMLRILELQLTGKRDGENYIIDASQVLYADTADKKTFLYTEKEVYETDLHLYELEERLAQAGFFRASKSCIINFKHIVSIKAELDRKIRVTLTNGEKLMISRQYAEQVKKRLEVR